MPSAPAQGPASLPATSAVPSPSPATPTPRESTAATPARAATAGAVTGSGSRCRSGDPLANVYHAYRLHVVKDCLTVTGTVAYVSHEDDGDLHVNIALPASESNLLNQANMNYEYGNLVTEIVPADQPGCPPGRPPALPATAYTSPSYSYGICTGADIATPPVGALVSMTGPYVLDADHGWMEIHPVWSITILGQGSPSQPAAAAPAPAHTTQTAASAAWCQASAAPSNDGYPGDYQIYAHSNQPDAKATASDAGDSWSDDTNSSGYADIRLYHTSAGMTVTVTVGSASCSTTA